MATSTLGLGDAYVGSLMLGEVGVNPSEALARLGTYGVMIDWNANGNFSGAYDLVTDDVRHNPGIQIQRGKDSARPRSPGMVPSGSFELGNVHRRYSAENGSSPLFGLIAPDKPVKVTLQDVVNMDLITGAIDEPQQLPARDERAVGIQLLGKTATLRGQEISTLLYQQISTSQAVNLILDACGWPALERRVQNGDTIMNYWWLDNQDAWSALEELLETEGTGASMFEGSDGFFCFENRNFRDMWYRSVASQGTFSDTAVDTAMAYQNFDYAPMMREVFNTVRITTTHRELSALGQAWIADAPLVLSAGETRIIFADFDDPITNLQAIAYPGDFALTSGSVGVYTATQLSATRVMLTFASAGGAIVTGPAGFEDKGPQLRAQVAVVIDEPEVSVTSVGDVPRPKTLSLTDKVRREISTGYAQSLCNVALAFYRSSRPVISIEMMNASSARLAQIATREVSDRITIVEPQTGVNRDIHIEQINHQINVGGIEHRAAFVGSAAPTANPPGLWGVGVWGTAEWTD